MRRTRHGIAKTDSRRRRSREQEESCGAQKFSNYLNVWLDHDGEIEAMDWLARHVGRLAAKAKSLERRVSALERLAAKSKGART